MDKLIVTLLQAIWVVSFWLTASLLSPTTDSTNAGVTLDRTLNMPTAENYIFQRKAYSRALIDSRPLTSSRGLLNAGRLISTHHSMGTRHFPVN
ncbi:MAG: hypothetical protein AB8B86_08660 [Pseudomonadales bacterium]